MRKVSEGRAVDRLSQPPVSSARALDADVREAEGVVKDAVSVVFGTGPLRSARILIQAIGNCAGGLTSADAVLAHPVGALEPASSTQDA